MIFRSLNTVVGIATGYGLDDRGVRVWVPVGSKIFSSPRRSDRLRGSPNKLSSWYLGLFPGVKRQRREADHSPPTSAEVKKMWIYISTPPYTFMASAWLVKHRDNFTFYLYHIMILSCIPMTMCSSVLCIIFDIKISDFCQLLTLFLFLSL
jgi:hypothetical protein